MKMPWSKYVLCCFLFDDDGVLIYSAVQLGPIIVEKTTVQCTENTAQYSSVQ